MKKRRRRNLTGRSCGAVAVVFVLLWLTGQWWGELAAALPSGRCGVRKTGRGALEVMFSDEPALYIYRIDGYNWDSGKRERETGVRLDADARVMSMLEQQGARPEEYFAAQWSTKPDGWTWWPGVLAEPGIAVLTIPFWCLAVPFALVAIVAERRHRRWLVWTRSGRCASCGYNRTGIAADAVCPECGAGVAGTKGQA